MMIPINSTAIDYIGYRRIASELLVTFRGGNTYSYAPVNVEVYNQLLESESIGRSINEFIHNNPGLDRGRCKINRKKSKWCLTKAEKKYIKKYRSEVIKKLSDKEIILIKKYG